MTKMTKIQCPPVPAHLEALVEALGPDRAVVFLLAFGGGELYVGARPAETSKLVQTMGKEDAAKVARIRDKLPRNIPLGKPWVANVLRMKGLSVAEIATTLHVSEPTVRKYLNGKQGHRRRPDPRQGKLF